MGKTGLPNRPRKVTFSAFSDVVPVYGSGSGVEEGRRRLYVDNSGYPSHPERSTAVAISRVTAPQSPSFGRFFIGAELAPDCYLRNGTSAIQIEAVALSAIRA